MGRKVKPIRPEEIAPLKKEMIPDEVITIFNELIAYHFSGGVASIAQKDVVDLICKKMGCNSANPFVQGWLDVEEIFEEAGWGVEYDKPGFNEFYEAKFVFTARDGRGR